MESKEPIKTVIRFDTSTTSVTVTLETSQLIKNVTIEEIENKMDVINKEEYQHVSNGYSKGPLGGN